jgi:hypothetical protein
MKLEVNTLRQRVIITMLVCLLVAWVGAEPADTIDEYVRSLQEGRPAAAYALVTPATAPAELPGGMEEVIKAFYGRVSYEIHEVTIEGDEATVSMTIRYPNKRVIWNALNTLVMRSAMSQLAGAEGPSEEEFMALLVALYQDDHLPLVSRTPGVIMVQEDGWKILDREGINNDFFTAFTMLSEWTEDGWTSGP